MNENKDLKEKFAEIGLTDDKTIMEFNQKFDFSFDYSKNQTEKKIYTTNHTKSN